MEPMGSVSDSGSGFGVESFEPKALGYQGFRLRIVTLGFTAGS